MSPHLPIVRYLPADGFKHDGGILGVVGFGAHRPPALPDHVPFAETGISPIDGASALEIWRVADRVRYLRAGTVAAALTEEIAFGIVTLAEAESLEAATERAYLDILGFLDTHGYVPVRFWNYLPRINADQDGLERYRHFNIGRDNAFTAKLTLPVPPAASALGSANGRPVVYFLAAHEPAKAIENPRQVSAYAYPPIYGPRSPRFSRAGLFGNGKKSSLFISGTASIVGHETRHLGDPAGQIAETLLNIEALNTAAAQAGHAPDPARWALKIYLRDPAHLDLVRPRIDTAFGTAERLYLRADICRAELLLEMEAVCVDEGVAFAITSSRAEPLKDEFV